jgi:tetratricopeptide (TPR) repeat protein
MRLRGGLIAPLIAALFILGCAAAPPAATPDGAPRSATTEAPSPAPTPCPEPSKKAIALANKGDAVVRTDPSAALSFYEEASSLAPTEHRILYKMANAQKALSTTSRSSVDWTKTVSILRRAVELAPGYANYWFTLGHSLENLAKRGGGPFEDAKQAYQKCVAIDPAYAACYGQLGHIFLHMDDERRALESYSEAIKRDPGDLTYYLALADLYIRLDLMTEAEAVLVSAKRFAKPGDSALFGAHMLSAQVYQDRNDIPKMVVEIEAAKELAGTEGPQAILILFTLGTTYAMLKPPRAQESVKMLRAFRARACEGAIKKSYGMECQQALILIDRLGGSTQ